MKALSHSFALSFLLTLFEFILYSLAHGYNFTLAFLNNRSNCKSEICWKSRSNSHPFVGLQSVLKVQLITEQPRCVVDLFCKYNSSCFFYSGGSDNDVCANVWQENYTKDKRESERHNTDIVGSVILNVIMCMPIALWCDPPWKYEHFISPTLQHVIV